MASTRQGSSPTRPSTSALIAHILRRTTFGPFPGQVESLLPLGVEGVLDKVIDTPAMAVTPKPVTTDDSSYAPVDWWLDRMASPKAGLHEKMTWYWHGHLTTSHSKVFGWRWEFPEHLLLRTYALGNFRTMLQKITVSPAMLVYLDGAWSDSDEPNENYGRELMELFTLGRGPYTQDDVQAAAKALAGWWVDWDTGKSGFHSYAALDAPVTLLGRPVKRANDVIDVVCDHANCAAFVSAKIRAYFTGAAAKRLAAHEAALFRSSGLEIRPLVSEILHQPAFLLRRMNRPRTPVEWVIAAMAALGLKDKDLRRWRLNDMGQLPFYPPNVAGWPSGTRWLSASFALAHAAFATESDAMAAISNSSDPVAAALKRCSLYEVTPQTKAAMTTVAGQIPNHDKRSQVLLAMAVGSPEFALS
jgi:uncharacterized protein (DUF1800 family)